MTNRMGDGKSRAEQVRAWLPTVVWMALISYLSTDSFSGSWSGSLLTFWVTLLHLPVSPQNLQVAHFALRKSAHFLEYFVLGFLLHRALSLGDDRSGWESFGRVLLAGGAYALLDELHQAFTATRGASLLDSGVDFIGLLTSQLCIRLRNGRTQQEPLVPTLKS